MNPVKAIVQVIPLSPLNPIRRCDDHSDQPFPSDLTVHEGISCYDKSPVPAVHKPNSEKYFDSDNVPLYTLFFSKQKKLIGQLDVVRKR